MKKQTVRDIGLKGQRALVRAALNVPVKDGQVKDTFRIEAALPTINYVLEQGGAVLLLSHHSKEGTSLAPVAPVLEKLLGRPVRFIADALSHEAYTAATSATPGDVILFENLRFHPEEEANDPDFAKTLAGLGDVYVDDDFTTMHRDHASISGIPQHLPAVAGLLVEKEVDYIQGALEAPNRPLVAVLGGAKVSTKIEILKNLVSKVDALLLTGPIANTFALAEGKPIGKSVAEPDMTNIALEIKSLAESNDTQLFIPEQVVVSKSLERPEKVQTVSWQDVADNDYVVDATPAYADTLKRAIYDFLDFDGKSTIIWNGPLGVTEVPEFAAGSKAMADVIIETKGVSIVGGGDTAGFVDAQGLHDKFTWVSTGGGASLELMSGKLLPGLEALNDQAK